MTPQTSSTTGGIIDVSDGVPSDHESNGVAEPTAGTAAMNTVALARATAWLSERLPGAQLADLAAMLEIGSAHEPVRLASVAEKLGLPIEWTEGFVERHVRHRGGLAPLVELHAVAEGTSAQLSQVGHNILNQFWQRATTARPATW